MKDKILMFISGLLVGAILTTGVFMIINKNQSNTNNNGTNFNNRQMTGTPPTEAELEGAQKTIMEDGSVRYDMPGGGVLMQKTAPDSGGPTESFGQ